MRQENVLSVDPVEFETIKRSEDKDIKGLGSGWRKSWKHQWMCERWSWVRGCSGPERFHGDREILRLHTWSTFLWWKMWVDYWWITDAILSKTTMLNSPVCLFEQWSWSPCTQVVDICFGWCIEYLVLPTRLHSTWQNMKEVQGLESLKPTTDKSYSYVNKMMRPGQREGTI